MKYSVLALDQSMTATGFAHFREGDARPYWGVHSMPSWGNKEGLHLCDFQDWLTGRCHELAATHLFFENTFLPEHNESLTMRIAQYGLMSVILMVGHRLKISAKSVDIKRWRLRFLGTDRVPKHLVSERNRVVAPTPQQRRTWFKNEAKRACAQRGWMVDDDNAAEALGILNFGLCTIDPRYEAQSGPLFRRQEQKRMMAAE